MAVCKNTYLLLSLVQAFSAAIARWAHRLMGTENISATLLLPFFAHEEAEMKDDPPTRYAACLCFFHSHGRGVEGSSRPTLRQTMQSRRCPSCKAARTPSSSPKRLDSMLTMPSPRHKSVGFLHVRPIWLCDPSVRNHLIRSLHQIRKTSCTPTLDN